MTNNLLGKFVQLVMADSKEHAYLRKADYPLYDTDPYQQDVADVLSSYLLGAIIGGRTTY